MDFPPFRRPKESHRPGGVKSGPSRSRWWAAVLAARLDPARPARFASIAETTGSPNSQSSVQKHQGCGDRWRRPGGRRLGRRTRHQGHGVVADGTDPAMVGNNRPKYGRLLPTMRPLPVGPWRRCARGEETGGVWLTAHRTATSRSPTDVSGAPDLQASPTRREVQTGGVAYKTDKHQGCSRCLRRHGGSRPGRGTQQ